MQDGSILFSRIVLFGVGLIGGSFALSLRKSGYAGKIIGVDRNEKALQRALERGLIDESATAVADAVRDADLILLAAPVAQTGRILALIKPFLSEGTLISDAGSTKSDVIAAAYEVLGDQVGHFIGAHPIAGREVNGPDAALNDLFSGKKVVITPLPENSQQDIEKIARLWRLCGAEVHFLRPEDHDTIFAAVSHLPHLLSYALVDQVARHPDAEMLFQYAASGFRDFTRIAGSSPEMWRDISMANKTQLLKELDAYISQLGQLRNLLQAGDAAGIEAVYASAQKARLDWINTIESAEKEGI